MATAHFRFYAELNDFLSPRCRQRDTEQVLARDATVKHAIEAMGVPHTEVDLILVNGMPVDFSRRLDDGDHVSIYPHFSQPAIEPRVLLRPSPRQGLRFIADAHLGLLAKNLRMLGFDVLYRNDYNDAELAAIAATDDRIVLTRDRDLLIRKEIVHGCYLHTQQIDNQITEVMARFGMTDQVNAFTRCLSCNGLLRHVEKEAVVNRVPPHSHLAFERFFECDQCEQVYWEGSHVSRMRQRIAAILGAPALNKK